MDALSMLLAFCMGNSPVTSEFPSQRPVTWSSYVFFYLRLHIQLSKQLRHRWFEMPSHYLWHHCNDQLSRQSKQRSAMELHTLKQDVWRSVQRHVSGAWINNCTTCFSLEMQFFSMPSIRYGIFVLSSNLTHVFTCVDVQQYMINKAWL